MIKLASPGEPLLSINGLSVAYGTKRSRKLVLSDVTMHIAAGETVGIIGESGSGKTTLAKAIVGMVAPLHGNIRFNGQDIGGLGRTELRRFRQSGEVCYVFQDPLGSLDPQWTIFQSIEEALILKGEGSKSVRDKTIAETADSVRLDRALLDKRPSQLSGGQRQRAVIARALVGRPKMIIADEPVSALDSATRVQVLELFASLRGRDGISQIFVSHDLGSVAYLVDRVFVLFGGRIVESGPPSEVIRHPKHDYTRELVDVIPRLKFIA